MSLRDTVANRSERALARVALLCVDGNADTREIMTEILTGQVRELHMVESGETALLTFAKYNPDLVITGLNLPGLDGLEMLGLMRSMSPELPVVVSIDGEHRDDLLRAVEFQANAYLIKPFAADKLLNILEDAASSLVRRQELAAQRDLTTMTLDSLPHPAMLVDFQAERVLTANKVAQRLGYHPGGGLRGELLEWVNRHFTDSLQRGTERYQGRRIQDLVGHDRVWDVTTSPVGRDVHLYYAVDVSERKRMERLREDVERIVRHDLKSPLSPIIGFSELIMLDPSAQEIGRFAGIIHDAGKTMLDLINNSLDIYKMENGTYEIPQSRCDLRGLLEKLERDFAVMSKSKRVRVTYLLNGNPPQSGSPAFCRGEQRLIYSMCSNLLRNAIEASPMHGEVSFTVDSTSGMSARIHNSGAVPKDVRERFFQMYATSGKRNGTGLGTYSAKLIARAFMGDITYETSEENGTTLHIYLP